MDLNITNHSFLICGVTSGFGKAIAEQLMAEGANVIGVARTENDLMELKVKYGNKFSPMQGDITQSATIDRVLELALDRNIQGALINAGGPPALSFEESTLKDWDEAYERILRWKIDLTQKLLPHFKDKGYGRILYIESSAVKQPIENLVLSTSLRLAVVGMVKTLSQEIARENITCNILAPGPHETPAIERLIEKKASLEDLDYDTAYNKWVENIPVGFLGNPKYLASMASWLLSPLSEFVTGQVYGMDGGSIKASL